MCIRDRLSGYLSSWVLFSLFITLPQYFLHTNGLLNMMMEPMSAYFAAFVLIMAGIYQFTPYKDPQAIRKIPTTLL